MPPDVGAIQRSLKGSAKYQTEFLNSFHGALTAANSFSMFNRGSKLSKAITLLGTATSIAAVIKSVHTFYVNYSEADSYFVKIREDDRMYQVAEAWLMEVMPEKDKLSLYTRTRIVHTEQSEDGSVPEAAGPKSVKITTTFDGSVKQEVSLGRHKIRLEATIPDTGNNKNTSSQMAYREFRFMCATTEARDAVLVELRKRSASLIDVDPQFFVSRSWGNFIRRPASHRSTESVILKEGQMEQILNHVKGFLSNEDAFEKAGIPYHTGMMLHGLPGTGKSSTAKAVAHEFGMDVYYVSLPIMESDENLQDCFSNVPPRSMIILEDIDVVHATRSRKEMEERKGVTMQGLLNVLDGQLSPHGVVVVMTTNHLDVLDEAITRPGRVDLSSNVGALDDHQLRRICTYYMGFIPDNLPVVSEEDGITSATVIGIFREFLPDFEDAADKLIETINKLRSVVPVA